MLRLGIRRRLRRLRHGERLDEEYLEARALTALLREPAAPLVDGAAPAAAGGPLRVAVIVPAFLPGSGGHTTIANLVRGLEARRHACSIWIDDLGGRLGPDAPERFRRLFGPFAASVHGGFADWDGADVAVATGWQTVARVRTLPGTAARAYLVQDHEPEFFGTSAHRLWAEDSYRHGLHPITAGTWLAEVMGERYGLEATPFDLAVDAATYGPRPVARAEDTVLLYARASTPRRAVPLALVALAELVARRPRTQVWLYGHGVPPAVDFPARDLGVVPAAQLAQLYGRATVGLVLSMTNYSLVAQEMLACGLPCVELDAPSVAAAFGPDGPVELAPGEPVAIAERLARLLDDPAERARRADAGRGLVAERTWERAAEQVEAGLRAALSARTAASASRPPGR